MSTTGVDKAHQTLVQRPWMTTTKPKQIIPEPLKSPEGIMIEKLDQLIDNADRLGFDPIGDLRAFHKKFDLEYDGPPRYLQDQMNRTKYMGEELDEYDQAISDGDLAGQLDALVDLIYFAFGTVYLHGFSIIEAWKRVHHANMQKICVPDKSTGKSGVHKPEGWKPPFLGDLV